jgi:hypothetical protein
MNKTIELRSVLDICGSWEVRYLCWRACGETREESTRLANAGYMPAPWWMNYRDDGN